MSLVSSDTVNGFSFHPSLSLAASSSGERRFSMPGNCEDGETILNLKGIYLLFSIKFCWDQVANLIIIFWCG